MTTDAQWVTRHLWHCADMRRNEYLNSKQGRAEFADEE